MSLCVIKVYSQFSLKGLNWIQASRTSTASPCIIVIAFASGTARIRISIYKCDFLVDSNSPSSLTVVMIISKFSMTVYCHLQVELVNVGP
jgi:hypothetical protein